MSSQYTQEVLKVVVAKICQTIGWHSIQTTPLEILVDILHRYLSELSKLTHNYATLFGHTQPNIDELGLAFRDMHINIADLEEYVKYVDSGPAYDVPKFPVARESHLNFLKPGSGEVVTRPVHVNEHLPPMFKISEDTEEPAVPIKQEEENNDAGGHPVSVFKRPADISPNEPPIRRPRLVMEEEGRPTREISSVMMTTSGFLSPAREGKLPEARTPITAMDMPTTSIPTTTTLITSTPIPEPRFERKGSKTAREGKKLDKRKEKASKELFKPFSDEPPAKKFGSTKDIMRMKAKANQTANAAEAPSKPTLKNLPTKQQSPKAQARAAQREKEKQMQLQMQQQLQQQMLLQQIQFPTPALNLTTPKVASGTDKVIEGKLSAEPDKSKLNIFKKISKVKEEKIEKVEKIKIKDEVIIESRESSPDLIIDESDNKNSWEKQASLNNKTPEMTIKIEPVDKPVKTAPTPDIHKHISLYDSVTIKKSPRSEKDFLYDDDMSPPGTPSTPKTPEMPNHSPPQKPEKENKRKRKDKSKVSKKNKMPKYSMSPRRKNESFEGELDRPKTPNDPINLVVKDEPGRVSPVYVPPSIPSMFSFFPGLLPGGPGLIPAHNPLFTRLPGMPKHGFGQPAHIPSAMPVLPTFPPPIIKSQPVEEPVEKKPPVVHSNETLDKNEIKEEVDVTPPTKEKHKKDKKDKPKKKNKKDKVKNKSEKKKLKEEKKEKDKDKEKAKKEKREKKKEKEKEREQHEGSVPKLTLKIGSPRPPTPDVQPTRKLTIKPVVKKDDEPVVNTSSAAVETPAKQREPSPELARISALITRPPKSKTTATVSDIFPRSSSSNNSHEPPIPPFHTAFKKNIFRPVPLFKNRDTKRAGDREPTSVSASLPTPDIVHVSPPPVPPEAFYIDTHNKEETGPSQPNTSTSPKQNGPFPGRSRLNNKPGPPAATSIAIAGVKTGPGKQKQAPNKQQAPVVDNEGTKVWICPACGGPDDGSPMIGCDDCDAWYHWVCVGIQVPPDDNEDWYCKICIVKKQETFQMDKKKKRKKREKKEH